MNFWEKLFKGVRPKRGSPIRPTPAPSSPILEAKTRSPIIIDVTKDFIAAIRGNDLDRVNTCLRRDRSLVSVKFESSDGPLPDGRLHTPMHEAALRGSANMVYGLSPCIRGYRML